MREAAAVGPGPGRALAREPLRPAAETFAPSLFPLLHQDKRIWTDGVGRAYCPTAPLSRRAPPWRMCVLPRGRGALRFKRINAIIPPNPAHEGSGRGAWLTAGPLSRPLPQKAQVQTAACQAAHQRLVGRDQRQRQALGQRHIGRVISRNPLGCSQRQGRLDQVGRGNNL